MIRFFPVILLTLFSIAVFAQKDPIERIWLTQEKSSKIQIFKATDGKFYGKIVWLKTAFDAKGKPRTDTHNSNESLQNQPLLNLIMIRGFSKSTDDENIFESGTIYDPNNGKTYCGKIILKGEKIHMRGFLCNFSFLGRSTTWTLVE
jgi:uncharacterized protein (DUF2147 family)